MRTGLASVTFRALAIEEIAALAARAELEAIEWGGDVHVPHGDLAAAQRARTASADSGLEVGAYGSYYVLGDRDAAGARAVLDTAVELGAPLVRVWAGRSPSAGASESVQAAVVADGCEVVAEARARDLGVAVEHHADTLADSGPAARQLLEAVPGLGTYWQPPIGESDDTCVTAIEMLAPWLVHLHVFHWRPDGRRLPLSEGMRRWRRFFAAAGGARRGAAAMLEFVRDDDPAALAEDAATLRSLLRVRG